MSIVKRLKSEVKTVKWPNKKTVLTDMKIVSIASIGLMGAITLIDWISKLVMNMIF